MRYIKSFPDEDPSDPLVNGNGRLSLMSSIRIATPIVLAMGLALSACQQQAAETGEMEETAADTVATVSAEEQLETFRDDYIVAWEARDFDTVSAMMAPSYHEIGPEGTFDRSAAETMMKDPANMAPEGSTLAIDMETIEVAESGDVAYSSGYSTVTAPAADGREEMTETMNWVAGFKKIDGQWKIDRLAFAPAAAESDGMDVPADEDETGTM